MWKVFITQVKPLGFWELSKFYIKGGGGKKYVSQEANSNSASGHGVLPHAIMT